MKVNLWMVKMADDWWGYKVTGQQGFLAGHSPLAGRYLEPWMHATTDEDKLLLLIITYYSKSVFWNLLLLTEMNIHLYNQNWHYLLDLQSNYHYPLCCERATALKTGQPACGFWKDRGSVVLYFIIRRTICFNISDNIYHIFYSKKGTKQQDRLTKIVSNWLIYIYSIYFSLDCFTKAS
jgi:hypothetical protein